MSQPDLTSDEAVALGTACQDAAKLSTHIRERSNGTLCVTRVVVEDEEGFVADLVPGASDGGFWVKVRRPGV